MNLNLAKSSSFSNFNILVEVLNDIKLLVTCTHNLDIKTLLRGEFHPSSWALLIGTLEMFNKSAQV